MKIYYKLNETTLDVYMLGVCGSEAEGAIAIEVKAEGEDKTFHRPQGATMFLTRIVCVTPDAIAAAIVADLGATAKKQLNAVIRVNMGGKESPELETAIENALSARHICSIM